MNLAKATAWLWSILFERQVPKSYRHRACQGRLWRQQFPDARKDELRSFLSMLTRAFGYGERAKLKFRPDDVLLRIYRAHYPSNWMPDGLELETFAKLLEKSYCLRLSQIWSEELTLGQVFRAARMHDA